MVEGRTQRRLAAILAADVVGYSRLVRADEEGTIGRLKQLQTELVDPKLAEYKGRIVKLVGDGLLVEFASVVDAVRAAHDIQQAVSEHQAGVAEASRIVFRIGINIGDVIIDGDDIQGDGVNPSFAAAHYGLGLSQFFTGGDDGHGKSLDAAEMAMRLSPNDPMMWAFLNLKGMILFDNEDYRAAQEVFRRASEYPNAMFWIPLGLAASSWELGDEQGAGDIVESARADFPGLSVATIAGLMGPAVERFADYIDPMRKAGLPEE